MQHFAVADIWTISQLLDCVGGGGGRTTWLLISTNDPNYRRRRRRRPMSKVQEEFDLQHKAIKRLVLLSLASCC